MLGRSGTISKPGHIGKRRTLALGGVVSDHVPGIKGLVARGIFHIKHYVKCRKHNN